MHMNMRKVMKCLEKSYVKLNILMTTRLKQSDNKMFKKGATVSMTQLRKFNKEDIGL